MGVCSSTLKVAPAPDSKAAYVKQNAAGDAKGAPQKPTPTLKPKPKPKPKPTPEFKEIHGSDKSQFPQIFSSVKIDSKNEWLVLIFPDQLIAANFFNKIDWTNKAEVIVLKNNELSVKIRVPQLTFFSQHTAYQAVIDSIVDKTAYKDCQDFINIIRNPNEIKDEQSSNKRIIAVLNIVMIWSQRIRALRMEGVKSYAKKKPPNFKLTLSDILPSYEAIIKTDQQLCNAWNKISIDKLEVVTSISDKAMSFLLKNA